MRLAWGGSEAHFSLVAECRYRGQSHELAVEVESPSAGAAAVRAAFDAEHRRRNGFDRPDAEVELVVERARVEGDPVIRLTDLPPWPEVRGDPVPADRRAVDWGNGTRREAPRDTAVYRRGTLGAGAVVRGPAVVEDIDTTIPVPPGVEGEVGPDGSLVLRWR